MFGVGKETDLQFVARELMTKSQIIFAPYNYVIDPQIRDSMSINLAKSSIVFDEAHNILTTARSSAGITIKLRDFQEKANQFIAFMGLVKIEKEKRYLSFSNLVGLCDATDAQIPFDAYSIVFARVQHINEWLQLISSTLNSHSGDSLFRLEAGESMMNLLKSGFFQNKDDLNIISNNMDLIDSWKKEIDQMTDEDNIGDKERNFIRHCLTSMSVLGILRNLARVMTYLFTDMGTYVSDFRLLIEQALPAKSKSKSRFYAKSASPSHAEPANIELSILCLNAAIVFEDIKSACSSIILTSGTLAPLSSFANELNISFQNQMEGIASIDVRRQLFAAVVPSYHNVSLLGSYQNRSNPLYMVSPRRSPHE